MAEEKIKTFTDLKAWQAAYELTIEIYKLTKKFPKEELFCLVSQMRRASISISSNIAEGFGRRSYKEKIQFYYHSQGSIIELKNQLIVSAGVGYIKKHELSKMAEKINQVHRLLQGLINKSKTILNS